ncbi:hypothetical protein ACO0LO_04250 [Undibacterium sp. TJN25]|uniref:hypothetical protein n=1 Tax=Undibacterium sp. TJN25 TaxID=3413056 RepID=UPI003BEF7AE3
MKIQIKRLSPHQNGKVFGVMMAATSLIFIIPMMLVFSFIPGTNQGGFPGSVFMLILAPIFYLVVGYITTAIGCAIYNFLYRFVGGIEYENSVEEAHAHIG